MSIGIPATVPHHWPPLGNTAKPTPRRTARQTSGRVPQRRRLLTPALLHLPQDAPPVPLQTSDDPTSTD